MPCGGTFGYHFGVGVRWAEPVSDSEEPTPAPKVKVKVWSWTVESDEAGLGEGVWRRDGRDGLGKPELRTSRRRESGA